MRFTQHIVFYAASDQEVLDLVSSAMEESNGSGPIGARVLRFRDKPSRYVIQVDFASWEEAVANNDRPETQQWAARLREIAESEIKYENLDVIAEM